MVAVHVGSHAIDINAPAVRVALLAVTGLTLVAAIALPDAFGDRGALFAVPYAAVLLIGMALHWLGLRGAPEHQAALRSYLPVAVAGPVLVLAGGLAPTGARTWLWAAAVVVDVVSVLAAGRGEFRVAPAHFAERHGLIVIIALGESIVGIGATMSGLPITARAMVTLGLGFAVTALLWWAYFDRSAEAMEAALVDQADVLVRGHTARDVFTLGHLPMVAGVILVAIGVEEVLVHPGAPVPAFGRVALGVGVALFMWAFLAARARGADVPA
ncbi:MAG: low temperature requirement protein A, partial [Thermoleophilia bacterium]